jgi:hypothetical protein
MAATFEHLSCPLPLPPLDHLSVAELTALRQELHRIGRTARKEASKTIQKIPGLNKLWLKTIAVKTDDENRLAILEEFNRELVKHPEAFVKHAYANSLVIIDTAIHDEAMKRAATTPVMVTRRR